MTFYTHINRGVIDANRKHGRNDPPITIKRGKHGKATAAYEIELPTGARMIYSPHVPILPCGARLVVVSDTAPLIIR